MNVFQAAALGLLQGLTEFLPVSSSGHLILGSVVLRLPSPGLSFSIMVHLGTALATVVMLRREIAWLLKGVFAPGSGGGRGDGREYRKRAVSVLLFIVVASIPGALVGVLGGDSIDRAFASPAAASVGLLVTGFVLWFSGRVRRNPQRSGGERPSGVLGTVTLGRAVSTGIAQAIAIIPGISRSGSTITAGLMAGLSREDAARFSFLLSLPAVLGAALLDYLDASALGASPFDPPLLIGALVAFVAGLFALSAVFRVVRRGELSKFAYYCWAVGGVSLAWLLLRR